MTTWYYEGFVFNKHEDLQVIKPVYEAVEKLYGTGAVISVREEVSKLL